MGHLTTKPPLLRVRWSTPHQAGPRRAGSHGSHASTAVACRGSAPPSDTEQSGDASRVPYTATRVGVQCGRKRRRQPCTHRHGSAHNTAGNDRHRSARNETRAQASTGQPCTQIGETKGEGRAAVVRDHDSRTNTHSNGKRAPKTRHPADPSHQRSALTYEREPDGAACYYYRRHTHRDGARLTLKQGRRVQRSQLNRREQQARTTRDSGADRTASPHQCGKMARAYHERASQVTHRHTRGGTRNTKGRAKLGRVGRAVHGHAKDGERRRTQHNRAGEATHTHAGGRREEGTHVTRKRAKLTPHRPAER